MTAIDMLPHPARIVAIVPECADTSTFVLRPEPPVPTLETAAPGQFVMLSLFGWGEAAFTLSALPGGDAAPGTVAVTVRRVGTLTRALFALGCGARVGVRGPFGPGIPAPGARPILYVAGGCGFSAVRAAIVRDVAGASGRVGVVVGVAEPEQRIHRADLARWAATPGVDVLECAEHPDPGWTGRVGGVLDVLDEAMARTRPRCAVVCGPPAMLPAVAHRLCRAGLAAEDVQVILERHMKCGTGHCGHCYVGHRYVCRDGPAFSFAELAALPDAFDAPGAAAVPC